MPMKYCLLPERGVLSLSGEERISFLQGLVSNDVARTEKGEAVYAAFLTPQGKYLCDFFIIPHGESLLLDVEVKAAKSLKMKLTLHKLRAKVTIEDVSESYQSVALWGSELDRLESAILYNDPRLAEIGQRALVEKGSVDSTLEGFENAGFETYDALRISLGLPDGSRDLDVEKSILLEYGFDELNGVDWNKGCYMGQELTARTKYRALIKKRLIPLAIEGSLPQPGCEIMAGDKKVGEIKSVAGAMALGIVKLDALEEDLQAGGGKLTPRKPDWMKLPESA